LVQRFFLVFSFQKLLAFLLMTESLSTLRRHSWVLVRSESCLFQVYSLHVKGEAFLYGSGQALRVPGGWNFQFKTVHVKGDKVVSPMHRLPLLPQEIFLVLFSVRFWVDRCATVQSEGCQLKIAMTPSGNEPATFWLVEKCLNQLCHLMPQPLYVLGVILW
jgi:hypothetical protein